MMMCDESSELCACRVEQEVKEKVNRCRIVLGIDVGFHKGN